MKYIGCFFLFLGVFMIYSCKPDKAKSDLNLEQSEISNLETDRKFVPKLVLAQWTFQKDIFAGKMTTEDFIVKASELGFVGVEFVSQFFQDKVADDNYLSQLKSIAESENIICTMISVDIQDFRLGASDEKERATAIAKHKEWIVAASKLGCPTIRVNAYGDGTADEVMSAVFKSVQELANYGKRYRVRIAIENHGQYSSDGKWISTLVGQLFPYGVGSVADFDNWCIEREDGSIWNSSCIKEYDRYIGMRELLPTATSISLKATGFTADGNAIKTDYKKMFDLIKESQYDEYLAVEFVGSTTDPITGIRKTLELVNKSL